MMEKKGSKWYMNIPIGGFVMMVILLSHTVGYLFLEFYSTNLYLYAGPSVALLVLLYLFEKWHPTLVNIGITIICGMWGPICATLMPEFASLGYGTHNVGLILMVFFESKKNSIYYLLGSNISGWSINYCYNAIKEARGTPMPSQIAFFFRDSSSLGQFMYGLFLTYISIAIMDKERRRLAQLREQYRTELITLNEDIKKSNASLEQTNKTLEKTLAEKESFILRFSHEIRNPLNSLLGNVELCHESNTIGHEDRKMLKDAKVSGEILLQLLNNILDSTKVSTKRLELNIQLYDVRGFFEDLWVTCSDVISKAKLFGSLAINYNVPRQLEFDELRMRQIGMNLLTNAIKFTQKGFINSFVDFIDTNETSPKSQDMKPKYFGVAHQESDKILLTSSSDDFSFQEFPSHIHEVLTLTTKKFHQRARLLQEEEQKINFKVESHETRPLKVCGRNSTSSFSSSPLLPKHKSHCNGDHVLHAGEREGYLRIEVVDSGCGMKEEDLKNVFNNNLEKNKATVAAPADRQIGAGLGLWITKELIELMGGKIEIHSKPNVGTCLVIMIKTKSSKISPRLDHSKSLTKIEHQRVPKLKRALIVEDIAYNQEVNRKLIEKCGINHITVASNGLEAFEIFRSKGENYFDVILTDLDMPIMDGKTSTKLIREHEKLLKWKPVKIIVLTGYSEAATQQEMLNPAGPYRANSFLSKPSSFESIMKSLKNP